MSSERRRLWGACAATAALCLATGAAIGRLTVPVRREAIITSDVREEVRWRSAFESYVFRSTDLKIRRETKWLPSGEVVQVVELVDKSRDILADRETRSGEEVRTETKIEVRRVEAPRPSWSVGVLGGVTGPAPVGGLQVERRLGPVWIGAWGVSDRRLNWASGLSVKLVW